MAFVTRTVTGDLHQMFGEGVVPTGVTGYVETNLPPGEQMVFDLENGKQYLGSGTLVISGDGTWSAAGIPDFNNTEADQNPTGVQVRFHFQYVDPADRGKPNQQARKWNSGWLEIDADGDIGDFVARQLAPAAWRSEFMDDAEALRDETRTYRDEAAAIAIGEVPNASTTERGAVELATNTEAAAGTDTVRGLTPAALRYALQNGQIAADQTAAIDARVPAATTSVPGKVELATTTEATTGADTGRAVTPAGLAAAKADPFAIQALDRTFAEAARVGGGGAAISYADCTETTQDWAAETGWTFAGNAQVSGNRLYADSSTNPGGALKGFAVASDEYLHVSTLIYWKAGGTSAPVYVGIDCGTADHAPASSSPDGIFIGVNGSGVRTRFVGSNMTGMSPSTSSLRTAGSDPTADTTFAVTIDIGPYYVSMAMRDVADPKNAAWFFVARSAITGVSGKAINNLALFIQDSRGASGHSFAPVSAVKSRQQVRTKTLGGQTIEGRAPRLISSAPATSGDPWRIQLPANYDARKPSPLVMWCHQSLTGDADDPWTETRMNPLTQALADAGFIFAADLDGGDRWGNAASLAGRLTFYKHIRDNFNTGPLFLIGVSMGMLTVLNALTHRTWRTPAAAVSIGGVCNLDDLYNGGSGSYYSGIEAAYGFTGAANYEAATAGYNPIDREGWEFRGVPIRFYTSTGDTAVPKATGCDPLLAKILPYAPGSSVEVKSGGHLDASQYPPSEIVDFFNTYR